MIDAALEATIARETWETFCVDGLPLLNAQGQELGSHHLPVQVFEPIYRAGDGAGQLLILTARQGHTLCGYVLFWFAAHPHSSQRHAWLDAVYVKPAWRRCGLATRLMAEAESLLRASGCVRISQGVPLRNPALGRLLKRDGYDSVELVYTKPLAAPSE